MAENKEVLLEKPKEAPKPDEEFQRRLALFNKELELLQKKYEFKLVARLKLSPDAIVAIPQALDLKNLPKNES